ncbi:MAG: UDP-N-acetylglucosamine 2-epimerase [Campylobacterota bacterium]|nr:UDP-N-acetylglucosamine 2-epimerase [Campylobacterota bacterium]
MNKKKIVFLTGTRADFGKLKSLIKITQESEKYEVHIFVTGMHMINQYGKTINEIYKSGFTNIFPFINHDDIDHMDRNLSKTIDGFSHYISEVEPDLVVVHGDRIEAMAGAIVGSLNNILVAHIEGGEVSGTIDELIRHSISKLSHIHLVSNNEAKNRLIQMGEYDNTIFTIGSPDLDVMNSTELPTLEFVKSYYNIGFENYAILMFHPVTTEVEKLKEQIKIFVDSLIETKKNYIVIYPNNDLGSDIILREYERIENNKNFIVFPSLRFEYFLVLLKNAKFMIGNSSAGLREAPYYQVPTINIGSRQNNRVKSNNIINIDFSYSDIIEAVEKVFIAKKQLKDVDFGNGNSDKIFFELLSNDKLWKVSYQKQFQDIK